MRLKEIHLLTDDLERTFLFYQQFLHGEGFSSDQSYVSVMMGETKLVFTASTHMKPYYHFAFDIPINRLEKTMEWLSVRVPILPVPGSGFIADFVSWNARSFYFYDNNHNIVELICRYDTDHRAAEQQPDPCILYASEFGIVTSDVSRFSDLLMECYNLEIFSKQPRQENFTAIGDDSGLFIIAGTERNWYPTDRPSRSYPARIVFHSKGQDHELLID